MKVERAKSTLHEGQRRPFQFRLRTLLLLIVGINIFAAAYFIWIPSLRKRAYAAELKALIATSNFKEAIQVAGKLLKTESDWAKDVLEEIGKESLFWCFDRRHSVLLIHDDTNEQVYAMNSPYSFTQDEVTMRFDGGWKSTCTTGLNYSGIVCLESTQDKVVFLLKSKDSQSYLAYRWIHHTMDSEPEWITMSADSDRISQWRKKKTWPADWR